jgi:hypothetical protein
MRGIFLLALGALSTSASSFEAPTATGSYRLVPDDAVREHCRKHRLPLPKGQLTLRSDRTFTLSVNDEDGVRRTYGSYAVEQDLVRFSVEDGLGQELPHVMRLGPRGLNGRGAAFARIMTTPKPAEVDAAPIEAPTPGPASRLEGTWTAARNGLEDPTIRMTFLPGGRFRFTGLGVSLAGEYAFQSESSLFILTYREIDGQRVEDTVHIVKRVLLEEEGASFTIEKYVYHRSR